MSRLRIISGLMGGAALLLSHSADAQVINRLEIANAVKSEISAILAHSDSGLEVDGVFQRYDLTLDDGSVEWRVDLDPDTIKPGRRNVVAEAWLNGKPVKQLRVSASIKRYMELPMLKRSMKKGEFLSADDIRWKRIEVNRPMDGLVVDDADIIGQVAQRNLRENLPIRSKWFAEPLAIDRGDQVMVKLVQGGLTIRAMAVALNKGRVGDMIQLRNPKSRVRYEARVSAPGQAQVHTW